MRPLALAAAVALLATACTDDGPATSKDTEAASVCAAGATVRGVDVSYYQGTIDWAAARADGIDFAFIRVSDGTGFFDPKFDSNWANARAAGVLRGAYQFFRPEQDPIAQADLMLAHLGTLAADDLPPVLDVEVADDVAPADVAAGVLAWVQHVATATGRTPIIYTGKYFWQDSVASGVPAGASLWIANWGVSCPSLPSAWGDWAFWQDDDAGVVAGISGGVDTDVFNGDLATLAGLGAPPVCGDGVCGAGETPDTCATDCPPCGVIDASGGVVDDGDACFVGGGPASYMRDVSDAGYDGGLVWTHATDDSVEANFGEWTLFLAAAGTYRVEVYTAAAYAQSKRASYQVRHAGASDVVTIDQTAADGWQSLGDFAFAAGGGQAIHLGDDTGEAPAADVQLVFDAVRLTPVDGSTHAGGDDDGSLGDASSGCSTSGGGGGGAVALVGVGLALVIARGRARARARRARR